MLTENIKKKKWYQRLFSGEMFLALLINELIEEALEEVIATGITWIIGKIVNVLLVITITQGTKIVIKKIIKAVTYREGMDKMKGLKKIGAVLKNIWTFLWNNKLTEVLVFVGAYAGYSFYTMCLLPAIWMNVVVGIIIGLIAAIIAIYVGGETLVQIIDRLAATKLSKAEKAEAKAKAAAIAAKAKELEKEAHAAMEAKAAALVEAEIANKSEQN